MTTNFLLGMQGWEHLEWIGSWYPQDIEMSEMLGAYSRRFLTVEVDDTFYGVPPEPVVRGWRDCVPANFSFALKAPQQVTHEQRFAGQGGLLARFLNRVSLLEENLGPVLFLAPIGFEPNDVNRTALRGFVNELPAGFKWAIEFRHAEWLTEETFDLVTKKNVALVSGENRWIRRSLTFDLTERPTADFSYIRWNDRVNTNQQTEDQGSLPKTKADWAGMLKGVSSAVHTVYGYFNINAHGNGLKSAKEVQQSICY